jgi:hypothetical protein
VLHVTRYFFHLRDGEDIPDLHGHELPDDVAARKEAMAASLALVAEIGERFFQGAPWQMNVVDEQGRAIVSLTLSGTISRP